MTKVWKAQNTDQASYVGIVEFEDPTNEGDYIYFEVVKTETHLVFGNSCNVGLLESGNYEIDPDFSEDENLQELIEDLKSYYQDGKGYQSDRFSCNNRM